MQKQRLTIASSGAGAVADQRTRSFQGLLAGIYFEIGDLTSGAVDVVVTDDETGAAVLTITNASASGWYTPRIPTHGTGGTASLYAGSGTAVEAPLPIDGEFKVVITGAGNSHTGYLTFFVADA